MLYEVITFTVGRQSSRLIKANGREEDLSVRVPGTEYWVPKRTSKSKYQIMGREEALSVSVMGIEYSVSKKFKFWREN